MKRIALGSILIIPLAISGTVSSGQRSSNWLTKEFSNSPVAVDTVEKFINEECRPSGLDGIQILGVQNGHNSAFHLHVYCRKDNAKTGYFKVTMVPVPNRDPDAAVNGVLRNPNIRVGPFYFGNDGESDAFVLIEETR
jgi:hypothetical protein